MSVRDRANKLIKKLQNEKEPLDKERDKLFKELSDLLAKYKPQEQVIRDRIAHMHDQIRPLDKKMAATNAAKYIKNEAAGNAALDAIVKGEE